jgi:uncharacterized protein YneF (UPF0154 family)
MIKFLKSIFLGLILRLLMLMVGVAWGVFLKARMLWKGYTNKSKPH